MNAFTLFESSIEKYSIESLAHELGLHKGTVSRWSQKKEVPENYKHDFLRLLNIKEEVENSSVKEKDQYYTKISVAKECFDIFKETMEKLEINISKYSFVEPSAGSGNFLKILPKNSIGLDIDPKNNNIIKQDYLEFEPKELNKKYIVIGNPPFGLRGHLALKFINHSNKFADVVAFILPQLFESDGKGAPMKRVKGYELAYSEKLKEDSFEYPNGESIDIHTVFQIWTKVNTDKISKKINKTCSQFIKIYSLSDGGTPASTRNKDMLYKCDIYLPSTTFSGMNIYESFEGLPHRRGYGIVVLKNKKEILKLIKNTNWNSVAFKSTNSALNLRSSLISDVVVNAGYYDDVENLCKFPKLF